MLKNVAYLTPVIGVVRLGHVAHLPNGQALPIADDYFTIRSLVKKDGEWQTHTIYNDLLERARKSPKKRGPRSTKGREGETNKPAVERLREIPIRLLFSNPDLNVSERYEVFDGENGQVKCVGNGHNAMRLNEGGYSNVECAGASCSYGRANHCSQYARFYFTIEGQDDPMSAFVFRTRNTNGVNTLRTKLEALHSRHGERTVGLPLKLVVKSETKHYLNDTTVHQADIVLNAASETDAAMQADTYLLQLKNAGIDQLAYESRMLALQKNGIFNQVEDNEIDADRNEAEQVTANDASALQSSEKVAVVPARTAPSPSLSLQKITDDLRRATQVASVQATSLLGTTLCLP